MIESMNLVILIASILVMVAVFTSLISFRVGAPLLLVFLFVGVAAGEDGIGGIQFDNAPLAYFIGSIALALILFDSGFETPTRALRIASAPALTLATFGVLMTTGVVGVAAHFLLGVPWLVGFLFGAIVSSTDAAAVFFLLRVGGINLRDRTRSTLEVESGSNDPMAVFLTISLVELIVQGTGDNLALELAERFVFQIGLGSVLGFLGGVLIVQGMNRIKLEPGLVPIVVLACALTLFGATSIVGGSGFLAVYVAGLYAGNSKMRMSAGVRRFQHVITWLAQIAMFVTLGLLATPSEFGSVLIPGFLLALILVFVARPVAIWLCLMFFNFSRNDTAFISWVGLRGAVSILLAIVPMVEGIEQGQLLFNTAFIVVITSLLLQGWTIKPIARWLGIIVPARRGPVDRIDLELPGNANQEVVVYRVHPDSAVATGHRIPRWARPSLILRDGKSLRPHSAGRLLGDDQIYIFTPPQYVELLDQLFAGPAEGANDRDMFGDFSFPPDTGILDVGRLYGFPVAPGDGDLTLGELLERELSGDIEPADRIVYGPVELIVRRIDDAHGIREVGMSVELNPENRRRLPIFHSRSELLALWRLSRRRRLRRKLRAKLTNRRKKMSSLAPADLAAAADAAAQTDAIALSEAEPLPATEADLTSNTTSDDDTLGEDDAPPGSPALQPDANKEDDETGTKPPRKAEKMPDNDEIAGDAEADIDADTDHAEVDNEDKPVR
ncbi:potassium/proton antiporter [Thalassospira sp. NFXS8]|uniref:potassium/proton antiporter n=1 Tax=Thalassospira sp. NFXS8 TaxID=2819093 RepID=UPI0032DF7F91